MNLNKGKEHKVVLTAATFYHITATEIVKRHFTLLMKGLTKSVAFYDVIKPFCTVMFLL